jgi:anti-sigma factor (TIGR02949 family)
MNSPCDKTRGQLDTYLSHELPDESTREVHRHLESCPQCAAEFETRSHIRASLQAAVHAADVPAALESRVRRAVRATVKDPVSRPRTGVWAVAAAAGVILCVFLLNQLRVSSNPEEAILKKTSGRLAAVLNVGLRDHLQCAVFRKYSKQPLPASEMAADLGPEFAGLLPLVDARLPFKFRVIQAHHCTAGGREYTHLIMAGGGKIVSLILTRKKYGESLVGGIHQTGVDRFQVVGFESHDYLAYVISDLDAQQNLQLAANLAPTVRDYLAGHAG